MKQVLNIIKQLSSDPRVFQVFSLVSTALGMRVLKTLSPVLENVADRLDVFFGYLPRPVRLLLLTVPEQLVLFMMSPSLDLGTKIMVSASLVVMEYMWSLFDERSIFKSPEDNLVEIFLIVASGLFIWKFLKISLKVIVMVVLVNVAISFGIRRL